MKAAVEGRLEGVSGSRNRALLAFTECCEALDRLREAAEKLDHGSSARNQIQAAARLVVNAIDNMPIRPPREPRDAES